MSLQIFESLGLWVFGSLGLWVSGSLGLWVSGSLGMWVSRSLGLWVFGQGLLVVMRKKLQCSGCNHPFGKKPHSEANVGKGAKRKRSCTRRPAGGERKNGLHFMTNNYESVSDGKWRDKCL